MLPGLYVCRRPPSPHRFWEQRIRQAYDEFARPARLIVWLSIAPVIVGLWRAYGWKRALVVSCLSVIALAEIGRRRAGGTRVFPVRASLLAPLWILERAICAWLAVGMRLLLGGVPYRGRVLARAATPMAVLRRRIG
jgi:hypothetical protein